MTYREEIEGGGLSSSCECSRTVTTVNRLLRGVAALLCWHPPAAPQPSEPAIVDLSKWRAQTVDVGRMRAFQYSPGNVRAGWRCPNLDAVDTLISGASANRCRNEGHLRIKYVAHNYVGRQVAFVPQFQENLLPLKERMTSDFPSLER